MERLNDINADRIEWCCADYGITPGELAAEVGISDASMDKVLKGTAGLTFNQLSHIAEFFGRGVLFFLEAGPIDDGVHTLAFRTLANQKPELSAKLKGLIERVEHQRMIYLGLRDELANSDLPRFVAPEIPRGDPQEAALLTREWLGLAEHNDFDSCRAAIEAKGILVFRSNGYNGKWQIAKESPILGFTLYDVDCPVIVVKKQQWESQQTFTLIHELGHLLLHRSSSIDDEHDLQSHDGQERGANAFAGHLLVPDRFLNTINDAARPAHVAEFDAWLEVPRRRWGVSGEVILRRLLDSGRISQAAYVAYRNWRAKVVVPIRDGGNREWRHREPMHIFGDTFVRAVFDALNGRYISLSKASSYLDGLKINDLHQLERHYASL